MEILLLAMLNVLIGTLAGLALWILSRVFSKLDSIEKELRLFGLRVAHLEGHAHARHDDVPPASRMPL